ncbi:hypothetical protein [Pseudomonas fluorescens]|uniref:Uncharacterized protein n=1 Tax=Pseudomonas fluorescens TaxID=294 RepID=A0A5E7F0C3_PSEFL|nr:hypothetical protein [Pseudomonas fluorescens]VVO32232.1 hypothetical protein PS691_05035 [Pseudomonas fluorescens]
MATMAEIFANLNTGLGNLSSTPMGQFGTQMLMASGPQQGNPGGGARLGQAMAGMNEMQRQQALQQYRAQQIQQMEQQRAFQMQQAQAKAEQQQRQEAAMQSPEFQAKLGPVAQQMAALGMAPDDVIRANSSDALQAHRAQQLAQQQSHFAQQQARIGAGSGGGQPSGPKIPTPRQVLEEPLENNMVQRHLLDPTTGQYRPYGRPYPAFAPGRQSDPMDALLEEVTPDDNVGAGPAVPGLPGANAAAMQPARQGAELLMHGSGSNPMARKPATPKTQADYAALPAGSAYIDPVSGKVAIKRGK